MSNEIKCTNCGKKLAEAKIQNGFVEIKCKCGTVNKIIAESRIREVSGESFTEKVSKGLEKK
jgi:phage FluMu protein Com